MNPMSIYMCYMISILSTSAFSQNSIESDSFRIMVPNSESVGIYIPDEENDTCYTKGLCINYYIDGRKKSEGNFIRKRIFSAKIFKDGIWKYYYYNHDKTLIVEKRYERGVLILKNEYWMPPSSPCPAGHPKLIRNSQHN